MAGTCHFYLDAATALWEAPLARLEDLKTNAKPEALRRAAQDALLMKAQFITPDSFDDERKAVTILAAALEDDPDFTLDLAMRVGGRRDNPGHRNPRPGLRYRSGTRRWKAVVALAVAVSLLLALEILANAGVPVPSPIDDVIDQLTDAEPAEVLTRVPSSDDTQDEWRHGIGETDGADLPRRKGLGRPTDAERKTKTKNTTQTKEKSRNATEGKRPREKHKKEKAKEKKDNINKTEGKTRKIRRTVGRPKQTVRSATPSGRGRVKKGNGVARKARR